METSVNKACRTDKFAPKTKHLVALCSYSWENKATLRNMVDLLGDKLTDSHWTVVFKSLLVIHTLMRDGAAENVFNYLLNCNRMLNVSHFRPKPNSSGIHQTKNLRLYASYLEDKVEVWRKLKVDFGESRTDFAMAMVTNKDTVKLLTNLEALQKHLDALLNTRISEADIDNEVTLYCFRLLIRDCLKLFQLLNHGIIFMLKHYFDMSVKDATQALAIYRKFTEQAQSVTEYLKVGKTFQSYLGFNIPSLKHAPVSLAEGLEEYLKNPNKGKQFGFNNNNGNGNTNTNNNNNQFDIFNLQPVANQSQQSMGYNNGFSTPSAQGASAKQKQVIDFFESIAEDPTLQSNPYSQNFDSITRNQNDDLLNTFDPFSISTGPASSTNISFANSSFANSSFSQNSQATSNPFASLQSTPSNNSFASNQSFNPMFPPVANMNAMPNSQPSSLHQSHQRKNSQNPFSGMDFSAPPPTTQQSNPFASMASNNNFTNNSFNSNSAATNPFDFSQPSHPPTGQNTFNPVFPPPATTTTNNQSAFNPF